MPQYKELSKGAARDYARYRPGYPKGFFGDKAGDFEKELKEELLKLNPTGEFIETKNLEVLVARKA